MAISFVAAGSFQSGNAAIAPGIPAGTVAGDLLLVAVETANEAVTTPAGWTIVPGSPQSSGTAAATGAIRLSVFYKVHSGSESAPSFPDAGNHQAGVMVAYRGVSPTNPFGAAAAPIGSVQAATTAMSFPGITTTVADAMIVHFCAQDTDAASTTTSGTPTNANLTTLTERFDQTIATGVGGGIVIVEGIKAAAGATGNTTSTGSTSVTHAYLTVALLDAAREKQLLGSSISTDIKVTSYTGLPASQGWQAVTYGNGTYVALGFNTTVGAYSFDGFSWDSISLPASLANFKVVFGNYTFVAVCTSGGSTSYLYSKDGINWTVGNFPVAISCTDIIFGGGLFVVSHSSTTGVYTSTNGTTWTSRSTVTIGSAGLGYAEGTFVAVGGTSSGFSSTDGVVWTPRTLPTIGLGVYGSVAYSNGTFLASTNGTTSGAVSTARSSDGVTWEVGTDLPKDLINSQSYLLYAAFGYFFCIGTAIPMLASVDGITWFKFNSSVPNLPPPGIGPGSLLFLLFNSTGFYHVTFDKAKVAGNLTTKAVGAELICTKTGVDTVVLDPWVQAGDVAIAMAYRDGSATPPTVPAGWTTLDSSGTGTNSSVLAWDVLTSSGAQTIGPFTNATSLAVAVYRGLDPANPIPGFSVNSGTGTTVTLPADTTGATSSVVGFAAHQSTDVVFPKGVQFSSKSVTLSSAQWWTDVVYGEGIFVAIARNTSVGVYSSDGVNWTNMSLPANGDQWSAIAYGEGTFVAVCQSSTAAASSPDGINWTARTLPSSASWCSLAYGNGVFVALTTSGTSVAYSLDGITWTSQSLPIGGDWRSITFGNGVFVAVSYFSDDSVRSTDGITWTNHTLPTSGQWGSVVFGNGVFVTAKYASLQSAVSSDSITWTSTTMPNSSGWSSVSYGNGVFVYISSNDNNAAKSEDGITWELELIHESRAWEHIAYGLDFVCISGYASVNSYAAVVLACPNNQPVLRASQTDATDSIAIYDTAGVAT